MSSPFPPAVLFDGLFDDAAVFPPGSFPLEEALDRRVRRRGGPLARFVGPLLLPARLIDEALTSHVPLTLCVIGRPAEPSASVLAAAARVVASPSHSLAGIELPYGDRWRAALDLGVPLAVEVPAGSPGLDGIVDLAGAGDRVRAKLRTGATPQNPVPSVAQLAAFVDTCLRAGVAFKLTGGLHHAVTAVRADSGDTEFGFLNVLAATDTASGGAAIPDIEAVLDERDPAPLADRLRALTTERAERVRAHFDSYGCCDVLDPIHDLARLTLIEEIR